MTLQTKRNTAGDMLNGRVRQASPVRSAAEEFADRDAYCMFGIANPTIQDGVSTPVLWVKNVGTYNLILTDRAVSHDGGGVQGNNPKDFMVGFMQFFGTPTGNMVAVTPAAIFPAAVPPSIQAFRWDGTGTTGMTVVGATFSPRIFLSRGRTLLTNPGFIPPNGTIGIALVGIGAAVVASLAFGLYRS